ncbi:hypothetical protein [Thalassospira sp.]|uniref:hypothetical protein n=1 Tax=Thalassospira sp. TaxID=1912094 RepID=UPI00273686D8|nr:hypothetical protein [Thalassospira sp.]MDP2697307.1 hypothetical protein [Thalassospira sp.]
MTKHPPQDTENTTPKDFANVTPDVRDLYPTSDIRLVMIELGNLKSELSSVKSAVGDLDKNDRKMQGILNQIKGGLIVGGIALAFFGWVFSERVDALKDALISSPVQTQAAPALSKSQP